MDGMQADLNSGPLQYLFDQCPPISFAAPWAFLRSDHLCRGSLRDPAKNLDLLRGNYSLDTLQKANIVEPTDHQGWRLRPELCNPVGGLIGLRGSSTHPIDSVMTCRGSLPQRLDPWALAAKDLSIRDGIEETKLLLVTFSFGDAALLRTLELPAVLGLGFQNLGLGFLQVTSELHGSEDYVPRMPAAIASAEAAKAGPAASPTGPTSSVAAQADEMKTKGEFSSAVPGSNHIGLVLVGWSPYRLSFPFDSQIRRIANHFSCLRRHMGMKFPGISVWHVSSAAIENLKFRLKWKDPEIITDFLFDSLHALQDLEKFAGSDVSLSPPTASAFTDLLSAQDNLMREHSNDGLPANRSHRIRAAEAMYQHLVQSALISPLQEWALSHDDPVVSVVGMELAEVCRALHQMRPSLLTFGGNGIGPGGHKSVKRSADIGLDRYLKLCKQFGSLVGELCLLRDS